MQLRKNEKWTIAYRRKENGKTLLNDWRSPFASLPNSWRYWRADPFLFEMDGRTYLFAELFDRVKGRGVLGCCELTNAGAKSWRVIIDEPHHLSYPFVFQRDNEIYLIPESCQSGKITLYRAVSFPYQWEKLRDIAEMVAVDSTILETEAGSYMVTLQIAEGKEKLVLMKLDEHMNPVDIRIVSPEGDLNVRPAGNAFVWDNQLIRPAQNGTKGYGYGLNFDRISVIDETHYAEELVAEILPEDVSVQGASPNGIHTYNFTDRYEVIDYKEYEFGIVYKIAKVFRYLLGKLR